MTVPARPSAVDATWTIAKGDRATIRASPRSYAVRRLTEELRSAERVLAALDDVLGSTTSEARVDVFLVDRLPDAELDEKARAARGGVLVHAVEAGASSEFPLAAVTRLVFRQRFSEEAASSDMLVDGLAGVVAADIGLGPSAEEFDALARDEVARGVSPLLGATPPTAVAASFLRFLLDRYGRERLVTFLEGFAGGSDKAALTAFEQPPNTLEDEWRRAVTGGSRHGAHRVLRELWPLVRPYRRRALAVVGYMLLGVGATLALPLASKYLVDTVVPRGEFDVLAGFIAVVLAVFLVDIAVSVRGAYVSGWLNRRVVMTLQERVFERLQHLSHDFYDRAKTGDVMSRLSNDVLLVQRVLDQILGNGVLMALTALGTAVTMLALSPLLALLVFLVIPLSFVLVARLGSRFADAAYQEHARMGEVATLVQENLRGHAVVKAFGLQESMLASYRSALSSQFKAYLRLIFLNAVFESSIRLAATLGQVVIFTVGGYLAIEGHITLGTLIAFVALLPSLFGPIAGLSEAAQAVEEASGALERVNELLDAPVTVVDRSGARPLPRLKKEIRLEGVSLAYPTGPRALDGFDATIEAGSHIAIVGSSGAGKSSVTNLLLRFWDPTEGRVLFDSHDLRDATIASLRAQIGIVFQDTFVFDTSVRENIALAKPAALEAEIVSAARAAQLDSYVAGLPEGYETVVGEAGARLSGGQRQRLAIARAILRDPAILILDEATSALDPATEREIVRTLEPVSAGRTTITVTHRLALAAAADRVLVLEGGRLVEEGTHAELAAEGGVYQRLFEEQMGHRAPVTHPLQEVPLFADVQPEALTLVREQVALERYPEGATVVREGDPGDRLYAVRRGELEVVVNDDFGERVVNLLRAGDFFGELALLSGEPRSATVRTIAPAELYSLGRDDFELLLESAPEFRAAVRFGLAKRRSIAEHAAARAAGSV